MACRNMNKANAAKDNILKAVPSMDLDVIKLDLGDLASVKNFSNNFLGKYYA